MRGLRVILGAAALALLAGSGCCRWWCGNCERFCGQQQRPTAYVPGEAYAPQCQPVCCPVGTAPVCCPAGSSPVGNVAPVPAVTGTPVSGQWSRQYYEPGCP